MDNLTFRHLRLTETACFREYLENTRLWGEVGNEAFAEHVRAAGTGTTPSPIVADSADKPWRLYHSWLPQMMELTLTQAQAIRGLIQGVPEADRTQEQQQWTRALADFGWLTAGSADIDCLVTRALEQIIAIQNPYELREYLKLVQARRPKVVVEIGTARGGMLYCFCQLAAPDALILSIDLPGAPNCGGQTEAERKYYSSFVARGQQIKFIPANSHFHATREALRQLLGGQQADVLFIDGDHSYGGVKIDFDMYAGFAAADGLLTLHDICLRPEHWGAGNDVGLFWDEIKPEYEIQEIIDPNGQCQPDRPEGVDACWGIGIIGAKRLA
jgi:hypothetical protein